MKKIFVFILILGCLSLTLLYKVQNNPLFEMSGVEKVCFVSSEKLVGNGIENVSCGDKFFNYCSLSTAKNKLDEIESNLDGLQFYISNMPLNDLFILLKCQQVSLTEIGKMKIYCGYTPFYQDCVFVENKKVNVQIAVIENQIVAGFPMILTGY